MGRCTRCGKNLSPAEMGDPCSNCGGRDREVSDIDQGRMIDVAEAAETLARKHYDLEPGLVRIFRINVGATDEGGDACIRLLEVSEDTPESGVMPLHFGAIPASGVPLPSVIIEVSPAEFERIRSNDLKLPEGWTIGQELARSSVAESH